MNDSYPKRSDIGKTGILHTLAWKQDEPVEDRRLLSIPLSPLENVLLTIASLVGQEMPFYAQVQIKPISPVKYFEAAHIEAAL